MWQNVAECCRMLQKQELMQLMHSDMTWIRNNLDICVPPWVMPLGATKMLLPHLPWQIGVSRRENTDYRLDCVFFKPQASKFQSFLKVCCIRKLRDLEILKDLITFCLFWIHLLHCSSKRLMFRAAISIAKLDWIARWLSIFNFTGRQGCSTSKDAVALKSWQPSWFWAPNKGASRMPSLVLIPKLAQGEFMWQHWFVWLPYKAYKVFKQLIMLPFTILDLK